MTHEVITSQTDWRHNTKNQIDQYKTYATAVMGKIVNIQLNWRFV